MTQKHTILILFLFLSLGIFKPRNTLTDVECKTNKKTRTLQYKRRGKCVKVKNNCKASSKKFWQFKAIRSVIIERCKKGNKNKLKGNKTNINNAYASSKKLIH